MGEIAALGNAFDAEFGKALSSLPSTNSVTGHDGSERILLHHRQSQRIIELIAYYGSKLPAYASVQRILSCAERLVQRHEHKLAKDACYAFVRSLALHEQADVQRMDTTARLSYHAQACMGAEACEAALVLLADAHIKHPDTIKGVVQCLGRLQAVVASVLPVEAVGKIS